MNIKFPVLLILCASATFTLNVQAADLNTLKVALKFRADMATAVSTNQETVESALQRLKDSGTASGLTVSRDADFAQAAFDVGLRLMAADKPAAAELFFRAAEPTLEQVANQTPVTQAREKAQYLQKLAMLRGKYLNKAAQARDNMDAAVQLQPDDKSMVEVRAQLARGHGDTFKATDKK